jgi:hypothetical protein
LNKLRIIGSNVFLVKGNGETMAGFQGKIGCGLLAIGIILTVGLLMGFLGTEYLGPALLISAILGLGMAFYWNDLKDND